VENIKALGSPEVKEALAKYSHYLVEARKKIIFTLIVFVLATFVGFFFYEQIIKFLVDFLSLTGINIVFTSPFQFINLAISCGVATGIIFSFPLLVFQIMSFLKPALRGKEYKMIMRLLPFSLILFALGFSFGVFIMKWQVQIFLSRAVSIGIGNILDISKLLSVVLLTSALMGIGFQFPILLLLLLRIGLITNGQLRKIRKWVYLGSFVFALLLPPDSILADVLLSLPLIILYEITLILDRTFDGHRLT